MTPIGISTVWLVFPILIGFLFHSRLLEQLGLGMARYRARSSLARSLADKMVAERELEQFDRSEWYSVKLNRLTTNSTREAFIQLHCDDETEQFIQESYEQSDWILTQLWYNIAKSVLSWFYCQTDINGMLNRGSMFVFSKEQIVKMTGLDSEEAGEGENMMLDLGAGDGRPTLSVSSFFSQTFVTEMSRPMQRLLEKKGFIVVGVENWVQPGQFRLISALNLLDRCDKPLSILQNIHTSLQPGGWLVIALVLPFKPYVESVPSHQPAERLGITGETFEPQVEAAVEVITALGFSLHSWARVPYLCEGDLTRPIYSLNNALMVFRKA